MSTPYRVLIVDDSALIRQTIRAELENGGYEIMEAKDGLEAIVKVRSANPPDLITMDVNMPAIDGFETCRRLRQEHPGHHQLKENDRHIPILFVTGRDSMENRKKGFELGAVDFISKPFAPGQLLTTVTQVLSPKMADRGMRALVVDDSAVSRRVVASCMQQEGIGVIEAVDGKEAYDHMCNASESIDVIITDLLMPGMDGKTLCHKVRTELGLRDLPIIVLTALSDTSEILEVFKSGGSDYLVKPFAKEELVARIGVHIERNEMNKKLRTTIAELQEANRTIQELSIRDPLTSCFNKRYLNRQLAKEIKRAIRYCEPLSIIIADIDYFKLVNDTHGHQCGDDILVQFVSTMQTHIRQDIDWIARYGGEEFVIVLPETGPGQAEQVAEKLRQAVATSSCTCNHQEVHITASFGVTGGIRPEDTDLEIDRWFRQADTNLYASKEKGRNCVVCEHLHR
ncbi:MAG: response regulator [Desulfovermiculus sp.]|nr:response regulator [Desulfovermiculus sp.]